MFGSSKPVVFESYGRRRRRRLMPRWLLLMLMGLLLGVAGVIVVQERYLPPRLSAAASTELRASFERADAERTRLQAEVTDLRKRLDATQAERKTLAADLGSSNDSVKRLRDDIASLVGSLPPDPRGGTVAIRAARFGQEGNQLAYDVVLSREKAAKPLPGVVQFVVAGTSARGTEASVTLDPVPVSVGTYESVRGSLALPADFKPRQATIQVLDKAGGRLLGMRVMYVNR